MEISLFSPSAGEHVLRVVVVESPEREWTLEYVVQVD